MSKKAVIELSKEELELLDIFIGRGIDESSSDYWDDGAKLMANIEEQAKKNRSIIEWHPMSEKPEGKTRILVKYSSGRVFIESAENDLSFNGAKEWAYLPE